MCENCIYLTKLHSKDGQTFYMCSNPESIHHGNAVAYESLSVCENKVTKEDLLH